MMQTHAKQKVHNFNKTHIVFSQKARQKESATFEQKKRVKNTNNIHKKETK